MKIFSTPVIISIAIIFYIIGFMMDNNNYVIFISKEVDNQTIIEYVGKIIIQLSAIFLTAYILKYLLGMNQFKNAIKNIFIEIFSEHQFLKGLDKISLLNIAKNVSFANKDIIFNDKTKDNESVLKLKNYFETNKDKNKEKNYLVVSSCYKTTLLTNGIEIMHRKIVCKVLKKGKFFFEFIFTAPEKNENLNHLDYENGRNKNRFSELSYDSLLKSSCVDDGFHIVETFSLEKNAFKDYKGADENGVKITFEKLHTIEDEIITIEFSISHPFKLSNLKEIEDYYNSTYSYPHAIRNIIFQQERYKCSGNPKNEMPIITPVLYSKDDNLIPGSYEESIYYKTYKWEVFYSHEDSEKVSFKIE